MRRHVGSGNVAEAGEPADTASEKARSLPPGSGAAAVADARAKGGTAHRLDHGQQASGRTAVARD